MSKLRPSSLFSNLWPFFRHKGTPSIFERLRKRQKNANVSPISRHGANNQHKGSTQKEFASKIRDEHPSSSHAHFGSVPLSRKNGHFSKNKLARLASQPESRISSAGVAARKSPPPRGTAARKSPPLRAGVTRFSCPKPRQGRAAPQLAARTARASAAAGHRTRQPADSGEPRS